MADGWWFFDPILSWAPTMLVSEVLPQPLCKPPKPTKPKPLPKLPVHPDAIGKPKKPKPFNQHKPANQS